MTIIEGVPIAISVSALLLSVYTYFKHDRKIKDQNKLINKYTLEKLAKENELEKKAIIEANVIKGERGSSRIIKVYNKGKAVAKNVVVSFPDEPNVHISEYPSPIDIKPQNSIDINLTISYGPSSPPNTIKINFEWEDGIKLDNRDTQIVQLR